MKHSLRNIGSTSWLWIILVAGVSLRVALWPFKGSNWDSWVMKVWAISLGEEGAKGFYDRDLGVPMDHLPGDLYILWLLGWQHDFDTSLVLPSDTILIRLVPLIAEIVTVLLVFTIVGRYGGARRQLGAAVFAFFALGPMLVSGLLGQWNALSALLVVLAIFLADPLLASGRCMPVVWLPLAYLCLIKPQFAVLVPIFVVYVIRSRPFVAWWPHVVIGSVALVGVRTAIAPFSLDVGRLFDIVKAAGNHYGEITLGANNFWALLIGVATPPKDTERLLGAMTYQQLGVVAFAFFSVFILAIILRDNSSPYQMLVWSVSVMMITEYVWLTRMHERYMVEAIAPLAVLVGLWPKIRPLAIAIMLFQATSIGFSIIYWYQLPGSEWMRNDYSMRFSSLGIVVTWALLLRRGWMAQSGSNMDCDPLAERDLHQGEHALTYSEEAAVA